MLEVNDPSQDSITKKIQEARKCIEKALVLAGEQQPSSYNQLYILLNHAYRVENSLRIEDQLKESK